MNAESTIKGQRYRCRHCKSEDVRATLPLWINPNTGEHLDTDEGAEFDYGLCSACEEVGGFWDVCEPVPDEDAEATDDGLVRGFWRTLPDHHPVSREVVAIATGRPLEFVLACENAVTHGGDESALCGPAPRSGFKTAGQWYEFVRESQP